jgi:hypothetical protein
MIYDERKRKSREEVKVQLNEKKNNETKNKKEASVAKGAKDMCVCACRKEK